ncbi:MAG: type II secretion system GspH family protein [bacterium]|nr:type II secretion system GspH family protein [bacterium]
MRKAFTLVELLVTLMIIGVVAAITIPALLGSTDELQRKVGYKKSVSVVGQAVQLLKAKEIQCEVTNSMDLAACFNKVMLGFLANSNGETEGYTNVLVTPDGLAYQFLYYRDDTGTKNPLVPNMKTIEKICGDNDSLKKYSTGNYAEEWEIYAGNTAYCGVIVDANGLNKGTTHFPDARLTSAMIYGQVSEKPGDPGMYDEDPKAYGIEQFPVILTSDGAKAVYSKWFGINSNINRGYFWLYGISNPLRETTK